jgi:hypothetical protein
LQNDTENKANGAEIKPQAEEAKVLEPPRAGVEAAKPQQRNYATKLVIPQPAPALRQSEMGWTTLGTIHNSLFSYLIGQRKRP